MTYVGDAMLGHAGAWEVFERHGLACRGCAVAPRDTIKDAAACHPFDEQTLLNELNALAEQSEVQSDAGDHTGTSVG